MLEVIRERYDEIFPAFERSFSFIDDPNGGFGFPCDEQGNVNRNALHPSAISNLDMCLSDVGKTLTDEGVVDMSYRINHPRVCRCECGKPIEMIGDSMGELDCEYCGRVYNIFGQRLNGFTKPFSGMNEFGEHYDEDY